MPGSSSLFGIQCLVLAAGCGKCDARKLYCAWFKKYVACCMWGTLRLDNKRVSYATEGRYLVLDMQWVHKAG